ncbi:ABC transporter ATP-binding protein [Halanaerobacter jeridensis]|uniref:ABC-type quaternary amine transporter n=1 Tax=Halanaerobacter jeridensis TaxID=706427 RepID=A0A938XU79_9FIRM|nr:ABC transporter ATP-binding protein [Halanaerobacter jeridensis]MBM7556406.1 ABC-type Fe3+/spermidine/putrescine transport system ATPase subunit [Halanaerobacter jeridensis]
MVEIKLQDITKEFTGEEVIKDLDLTVEPGELVALLGPSGCGKTTTLNLIAGLLAPEAGDILFDGESVLDVATETRGAVLVFQDYLLFPHMNVADNIAFGLKMRGEGEESRKRKVHDLLDLVGLSGYEESYPHNLSGGQQQRVALARALAINPEVLLLDEPFSNLDANLRADMQKFIRNLHLEEEMTTIFVTHDRDEAMLIADRIAVMNDGIIEQYGTAEELYKHPQTDFVADFFGKANYLQGEIQNGEFSCAAGDLPVHEDLVAPGIKIEEGKELAVMIRPEFIEFASATEDDNCQVHLEGVICEKRFVGERIFYEILVNGQVLQVTVLPPSEFEIKEEVELVLDVNNLWYMEV